MSCFLSGLLRFALGLGEMSRQEPTFTFTVDVDRVLLDVYVGGRGQPVTGLRVEDFEAFDNGVLQEVELKDIRTDIRSRRGYYAGSLSRPPP